MKIVINAKYGGFSLSNEATELYLNKRGIKFWKRASEWKSITGAGYYLVPPEQYDELEAKCRKDGNYKEINDKNWYFSNREIERTDPVLVQVVEEMGDKANGMCARLKVVEIPDDTDWEISEYDGYEHVAEKHRTWG